MTMVMTYLTEWPGLSSGLVYLKDVKLILATQM